MRAVIYARVSSDPHQAGRSTDEQQAECRAVIDREGWTEAATFVDRDRSASRWANGGRPAYDELVEFLDAGSADVLVTWEASRTQRDLEAYVRLRELCRQRGVLWCYSGRTYDLSRTDDAFTTGLDALLAEREASQTRDRILRSVRASVAEGRPWGKIPYGYRRVYDQASGTLVEQVPREDQAEVVREAARRVLAGETPYAVAQDFNRRGIPPPRGGARWDLTQVRRLCTSPTYIGKRTHRGQTVGDGQWPAILDEETYWACVAKLSDPARRSQRDSTVKHLLSGIATCGVCDGRVRVQKNRGYRAYLCVDGFCVSRKQQWVDHAVSSVVCARLARPDVAGLFAGDDDAADQARATAARLRARLDGFYDAAAAGEITAAALARIEAQLLPEIDAAERQAARAVPAAVRDLAGPDAADRWEAAPLQVRRAAIEALVTVSILKTGPRRSFDPNSVDIRLRS